MSVDLFTRTMEVDGIKSACDIEEWYANAPMFSLLAEHGAGEYLPPTRWYRQQWNRPPTENELDGWVKGMVDDL